MKLATCVAAFGLVCSLSLYEGVQLRESRASVPPVDTELPLIVIDLPPVDDVSAPDEDAPLAVRNRNPFNIKALKRDKWKGQTGVDSQGHAIFESYEYGVRAAAHVLKNYSRKHKISTVAELVGRFAEGNREEYIRYICKRMGVRPDEKINMLHSIPSLLRIMARFESGRTLPESLFVPYDILAKI